MNPARYLIESRWAWLATTLATLFMLLGGRALNEPDEGRYAEIAREMLETGNWLVPHLWYVPHLDKPPVTYWAVAASMRVFGQNEWAVRLPLALAGLSGILAAYFFARTIANRRAAIWSALILQSCALYFLMGRMLTTDMILTQFLAWMVYCGWRGWLSAGDHNLRRTLAWLAGGWLCGALGFLTKGPVAILIPLAALLALVGYRWKEARPRNTWLLALLITMPLFIAAILPWFLTVFQAAPDCFDYMVKGQVVGHTMGTTIKNRSAPAYFFVIILLAGFLPWTLLLGGLWRQLNWRQWPARHQELWIVLTIWAGLTFIIFSLTKAKLPAYILPMFVPLAVLCGCRWFGESGLVDSVRMSPWLGRSIALLPALILFAIPIIFLAVFKVKGRPWQWLVLAGGILLAALTLWRGRRWTLEQTMFSTLAQMLGVYFIFGLIIPTVDTQLRANQTLKPLAEQLKKAYRPGDTLICWGGFPQGLPYYGFPLIQASHRPYLGGISPVQVPFEYPGNRERMGSLWLTNAADFENRLAGTNRVLVVGFQGILQQAQQRLPQQKLFLLLKSGRWELFTNRE